MGLVLIGLMVLAVACGEEGSGVVVDSGQLDLQDNGLSNTDLVLAFVVFRHGDRTPDEEELALLPTDQKYKNIFFPYGTKALTNRGKQRGFRIGLYLRQRYDGFISRLYLPDEISVRTTSYARTKMTALTALAALYPPPPAQKWNPALDWQPVPYDTIAYDDDDLLYWYNCPRYLWLRNQVYEQQEVKKRLKTYQGLFKLLSDKTGTNITTTEDVFFLDNLVQALENVGVKPPKWAQELMPKIKNVTKLEYDIEFYNPELVRLASGVVMADFLNASKNAMAGDTEQAKLHLLSAHENNVAGLMAAALVFKPHQPKYGSTFSLELRRNRMNGQYGVTAVYSPDAGGPAVLLPVTGCGGALFCDFSTFVALTRDYVWTKEQFKAQCPRLN